MPGRRRNQYSIWLINAALPKLAVYSCGFTRKDFYNAVRKGYKKIYKKEDNPGRVFEGPYGIWGHDLCDLYLEGFTEKKPGYFILSVGS